jgi:hypothetical protein
MQGLPSSQSGLGSGLLNTSRLMGGALGLAILSTIAATATRNDASAGVAAALTHGFGLAFAVGAGFCLAGACAAIVLLRRPARPALAPASADTREGAEEREPVAA